jgi:hypothetical protein
MHIRSPYISVLSATYIQDLKQYGLWNRPATSLLWIPRGATS